jgi:uncharacterized protein YyaL (SSP411 family)
MSPESQPGTAPAERNHLADAASSYLRSAAHQPIHWHEWGEAAFEQARKEDKPILLDVGAVWCHWCHVMDRESYEDRELAEIVNQRFVAIKVDRDERPDIDSRYQAAVQAISGQGGWPLTAFLTPDGRPFFGGTYFPAVEHWGRPSFKRVLLSISEAYRQRRGDVAEQADSLMALLSQAESFAGQSSELAPRIVSHIIQSALQLYDAQNGGFGSAPKFPHPSAMDLLIQHYSDTGEARLREVIVNTLARMAKGGVYDQLAGGFHRYSVDERWIVPHFEKMSYDNSELLKNYVHGWQATGDPFLAVVARDIIRWVDEWLSDREHGGFYASQDADYSLDDDGNYFTWSLEEARAVLSEQELQVASLRYDIGEIGEMHHDQSRNVLFVRAELAEIASRVGIDEARAQALLESAQKKMYAARIKRPTPYVDKTMYVNWNALCISAYLEAARALRLDDVRRFALRSLDRVLAEAWNADRHELGHVIQYSDPAAEKRFSPGLLDDYAFVTLACLDAYETSADLSYFRFALQIADAMQQRFFDTAGGGFRDAAASGRDTLGALIARRKPFQDSPTPAGNSAAAIALLRLHAYTNDETLRHRAEETLKVFAGAAEQYGIFAATYGLATYLFFQPHIQVVVIGADESAEKLARAAEARFSITKSVLRFRAAAEVVQQNLPPALAATLPLLPALKQDRSMAIVCRDFSCLPPIFAPDELTGALDTASDQA